MLFLPLGKFGFKVRQGIKVREIVGMKGHECVARLTYEQTVDILWAKIRTTLDMFSAETGQARSLATILINVQVATSTWNGTTNLKAGVDVCERMKRKK
jgi:hypothetical protein